MVFFVVDTLSSLVSQNPTLQAVFPGITTLNVMRTLQPFFTPSPNVTGFGAPGSAIAQLFYNGAEQFYCKAETCKQSAFNDGKVDWDCDKLQCTCRANTTFCGGGSFLDLTKIVAGLAGPLSISCSPDGGQQKCFFSQEDLRGIFGAQGLALASCSFGECVRQGVIDTADTPVGTAAGGRKSLSGGVIAGLAVVGSLVLLALLSLVLGLFAQKKARNAGSADSEKKGGVSVEWNDLSYVVPGTRGGGLFGGNLRKRKMAGGGFTDDKVVLDTVSGKVVPGQIMAILGPSGNTQRSRIIKSI
jgi:hypothetical protein